MSEIPKVYESQAVETKWYSFWEENECFAAKPERVSDDRPAYSIVIPPPNVTGSLPIGMMFYIGLAAAMVPCTLMVVGCSRRWFPDADGKHGRAGREETTKGTKVR